MITEQLPILIPLPLLMLAFLVPLVGLRYRTLAFPLALLGSVLSFLAAVATLTRVLNRGVVRYRLGGWPPPWGIEYVVDHLSGFLSALIAFMGLLVVIYSRRSASQELPERLVPFYTVVLLLLTGLQGIVVTGDLFNLYVFLEIASLSAYALMAVGEERAPMATFRYLLFGTVGASFYLLGVGFLYVSTGSLNMADVAQRLPDLYASRAVQAALALISVGLGLKMALFPLHTWLPDAYTYAPSAVTALIAPIMTKVSAYAMLRVLFTVFEPSFSRDWLHVTTVIGWLAAAGIVAGSVMAIAQQDFKRMLAYSSVAQVGYIGLGIGLANRIGLIGALLHIVNHAFMKGCLFLIAGGIRYRTGQGNVPGFIGLARVMPWTTGAFVVAALSMVGIPPLGGFFSKWYLVLGALEARNLVFVAVILVGSLLTAVYFFRMIETLHLKGEALQHPSMAEVPKVGVPVQLPPPKGGGRELPVSMLIPILVLAGGIVALGLFNSYLVDYLLWMALPGRL